MDRIRCIGIFLLAVAHGTSAEAKVSARPLSELIRSADVIVLAKVVKAGNGKVAAARVLERWKGEVGDTLTFSTERGWPCDVSGAVVDENAVLLLDKKYQGREMVTVTPGVYFLTFWGRGRMPIGEQGGKAFVRVQGEVVLPKQDLAFRRSSDFPDDNLVEFDKLKAYVRALVAPGAAQHGVAPDGRSPAAPARR